MHDSSPHVYFVKALYYSAGLCRPALYAGKCRYGRVGPNVQSINKTMHSRLSESPVACPRRRVEPSNGYGCSGCLDMVWFGPSKQGLRMGVSMYEEARLHRPTIHL